MKIAERCNLGPAENGMNAKGSIDFAISGSKRSGLNSCKDSEEKEVVRDRQNPCKIVPKNSKTIRLLVFKNRYYLHWWLIVYRLQDDWSRVQIPLTVNCKLIIKRSNKSNPFVCTH